MVVDIAPLTGAK